MGGFAGRSGRMMTRETGGIEGFEELYRRAAPRAIRLAFLITHDEELSRDLAQEAFLLLIARPVGDVESPLPYLLRTVENLAVGHFRRNRLEARVRTLLGPDAPSAENLPDVEVHDHLRRRLLELPVRQRTAVALRYLEDRSERETAEILGLSERAVNALVSRGLRRLRGRRDDRSIPPARSPPVKAFPDATHPTQ